MQSIEVPFRVRRVRPRELCLLTMNRMLRRFMRSARHPQDAFFALKARLVCTTIKGISRSQTRPFLVKIGAHDGVTTDPLAAIVMSSGKWTGLLVEPVPYLADRLESNYEGRGNFQVVRAAIGPGKGEAIFHYVDPAAGLKLQNLPV